jgi:hypothetical protein
MKVCTKCKSEFPATINYFCKDSTKKDSLHSHCKECSRKSKSKYYYKISPNIKREKREAKELYLSSEEYRLKLEESKIKDRERKNRWAQKNREKINASARIYNSTKRFVSAEKNREYKKRGYAKMMSCPYKKAIHYYRVRINDILNRGKLFKAKDIILFNRDEFIAHMESMFLDGMTWDNHGDWHIDHIKPIKSFDLNDKNQLIECWSLSNLQPLWKKDNLIKAAKSNYIVSTSSSNKSSPLYPG